MNFRRNRVFSFILDAENVNNPIRSSKRDLISLIGIINAIDPEFKLSN